LSNSSMLSESQSSPVCLEYLIDFMIQWPVASEPLTTGH